MLNSIFERATNLKVLYLVSSEITNKIILNAKIPKTLEEIDLSYNIKTSLLKVLLLFGKMENLKLKKLFFKEGQ